MCDLIFFLCPTLVIIDQKTVSLQILCNQLTIETHFGPRCRLFLFEVNTAYLPTPWTFHSPHYQPVSVTWSATYTLPPLPSWSLFMLTMLITCEGHAVPFLLKLSPLALMGKLNNQYLFSGPRCRFFLFELKYGMSLPFPRAKVKWQFFEQTDTLKQMTPSPSLIYKIY